MKFARSALEELGFEAARYDLFEKLLTGFWLIYLESQGSFSSVSLRSCVLNNEGPGLGLIAFIPYARGLVQMSAGFIISRNLEF